MIPERRHKMWCKRLMFAVLIAGLSSCHTPAPQITPAPQPLPEFPYDKYLPAPGSIIYRIDGEHSRADVLVRRGGSLARFGHDHVVTSAGMTGYVLLATNEFTHSRADLRLALDALVVDDPDLRKQYGLDTQPSAQDVEKTRENMRVRVLQTDHWPQAHLNIQITGGTQDAPEAQLTIYLHGQEHRTPITFKAVGLESAHLVVTGSFSMLQSDYGIQPFSVLGGGLQVLDPIEVNYRLEADRLDDADSAQPGD